MPTSPFNYAGAHALVTGASRGIGAAFAQELARRGAPVVVLVARSGKDLEALATELREKYDTRAEVIVTDLSEPDSPAKIKAETDRRGIAIDLLVNNAGFGDYGPFDTRPLGRQESMIDVNIASLLALTRLYLPPMIAHGSGGIVNVASTAGFQPVPYMSIYGATKAFVLSFSEALWAENEDRGTGVRVVCLCPGGTETDFGSVATDDYPAGRGRFERTPQASPDVVVKAGLDGLDRNRCYVIPGNFNYIGSLGARILPRATIARMTAMFFRPTDTQPGPSRSERDRTRRRAIVAAGAVAASLGAAAVLIHRARKNAPPEASDGAL